MPAPAPTRATNSLTLHNGLMTIPVSLFAGSEKADFVRHEYAPDGRKVGRTNTIEVDESIQRDVDNTVHIALDAALKDTRITQAQYDRVSKFSLVESILHGEIVMCADTEHGLIEVSNEEINTLDYGDDIEEDTAEVIHFLPLGILGTGSYVPESIMQVRPKKEKGKSNAGAVSAFALLLKGMRTKSVFALVRMNVRNDVKYAALMATGRLWVLKTDDAVREDLPLPDLNAVDRDELRVMQTLIDTNTTQEAPVLENIRTRLCWDLVDAKVAEGKIFKPVENAPAAPTSAGNLMATLQASVAEATKQD